MLGLAERHMDTLQKLINLKAKELVGNAMIYDVGYVRLFLYAMEPLIAKTDI